MRGLLAGLFLICAFLAFGVLLIQKGHWVAGCVMALILVASVRVRA